MHRIGGSVPFAAELQAKWLRSHRIRMGIEMNWYVVSTKPRQEKQAELHIKYCGIECFLPLLKETKIIRRVKRTVIGPLFPGYLFVRFDLAGQYRAVKFARGVHKIVEFDLKPAVVDDHLIENIKERLASMPYFELKQGRLKEGQSVRVIDGPFKGFNAIFEREMSDRQRVILLLQGLHFRAKLDADIDHVRFHVAI